MAKYSIKCLRCGAPIQWNKTALNVSCEYCGQPVNQFKKEDNFKNKFGTFLNKIPLPSKESIRYKAKVLLSKQKILSESQLKFIGTNSKRFFSKKRNIAILIAIPIASWGYMKINYPIKANLSFPETLYKPLIPKETGDFVPYTNSKIKTSMAFTKQWCERTWENISEEECISRNNYQLYFDKGSAIREGAWIIMKLGASWNNGNISTKNSKFPGSISHFYRLRENDRLFNDLAVNCKKGIMAWYNSESQSAFIKEESAYYKEIFGYDRTWEKNYFAKYNREKPVAIALKKGKLWWLEDEGSGFSDITEGEYNKWGNSKIERQKLHYDYNNLFKKTCKIKI